MTVDGGSTDEGAVTVNVSPVAFAAVFDSTAVCAVVLTETIVVPAGIFPWLSVIDQPA